ncbi:hypothetical protein Bca52824_084527 [Brassica carinata]|uniref:Uncharacterized protein n=1 Tax=Brassica carinata TaxID=52824 RepID=A0A8X7TWA3_BRACI|nr:hypothetical protein Bca52824_084527 [Brassica carinata]
MEMSRRDVRRGGVTNRFSNKLSRKLKKGMLKKLGLADVDDNMNHEKKEMMISNEFPASGLENNVFKKKKKSRLPKNVTHGVDHHASVPRKLRSAMKKRNVESVSASKKLNRSRTGIESFNIDLVKKENQDAKAAESISKDEKEVAETLYGLADMFTDTNSIDKNTCDPLLSDGKETSKVDSTLVVETECTTRAESLEPTTSFLSSSKPKQIDEEPLQQHHNQCSLTGLKQSSSVNEPVSTKPTLLNLLSSTKLPHWSFHFFIPGEPWEGKRWSDGESLLMVRRKLGFFPSRWRRRRRHPCGGRAKESSRPEPECRTRNRTGRGPR